MSQHIMEARGGITTTPTAGGEFLIRLIDEGQGSSGFYPAAVLEQAAAENVAPAGTHMYVDHPTITEDQERPERSVLGLVGVTTEDAYYDSATRSLVAKARIFPHWRDRLVEMVDAIGVSIRGWADITDGTVERLTVIESADFVTRAGRGGQVLAVLESERANRPLYRGGGLIVETAESDIHTDKETRMELTDDQYQELVARAEQADSLKNELDQLKAEVAEASNKAEADRLAADALAESGLPSVARDRIADGVAPIVAESGGLDVDATKAAIADAIDTEVKYLAAIETSSSAQFGQSAPVGESASPYTNAWGREVTNN